MASRLLLVLALCVGCSPCIGREAAPTQPRVRCWASRYPIAVDCIWTLPASPLPTRPTSFIATYRLGVTAHGESRPCLQPTPEATSCTIPDVQMFSMVPYILNVTAVQPRGTSSSFVPFVPEHIRQVALELVCVHVQERWVWELVNLGGVASRVLLCGHVQPGGADPSPQGVAFRHLPITFSEGWAFAVFAGVA
ncbi:interleukin-27 subunit beta [Puma concolor]|uniref:Interleukin-27 subunit beta n=1 Tax=Puma concolor TaxID=9696 RepID=A0A6P6H9C0_PUMCO|nr:interleukin-27 subunit beta [Puma concolor]